MKKIVKYIEHNDNNSLMVDVYFEDETTRRYVDEKQFAILLEEDKLARLNLSDELLKTLEDYKEALQSYSYEEGFYAGRDMND